MTVGRQGRRNVQVWYDAGMKRDWMWLLLVVAVVAMGVAVTRPKPPAEAALKLPRLPRAERIDWKATFTVDGVRPGMSREEVLKLWGPPASGTAAAWEYDLYRGVSFEGERVVAVRGSRLVQENKVVVAVGDTLEQMHKSLDATEEKVDGGLSTIHMWRKQGLPYLLVWNSWYPDRAFTIEIARPDWAQRYRRIEAAKP